MRRIKLWSSVLIGICVLLSACTKLEAPVKTEISVYASTPHVYSMTALLLEGVESARLSAMYQPFDGNIREREINEWELYLLAYDADVLVVNGNGYESYLGSLPALDSACPVIIDSSYSISVINAQDENTDDPQNEDMYLYMSPVYGKLMLGNIAEGLITVFTEEEDIIRTNLDKALNSIDDIIIKSNNFSFGSGCAVLCTGFTRFIKDMDITVSYLYDREPGTSLPDTELETVCAAVTESGTNAVVIENYAPEKIVTVLEEHCLKVIKLDLMESSCALEMPYTSLLENNAALLMEGLTSE